jgi:hydroxyacylglutathione hydrolase
MLPAGSDVTFGHVSAGDGEELQAGTMRLQVLHTPGHTHHHVSYTLADETDSVQAVFTGGSMLYGATGRTDLVSPADTNELTHAQYHSVQRLARELPAEAGVFPTHGFGSFCSATPTSGTAPTVEEQQRVNPALTLTEHKYVGTLLAGLDAYPAYYLHMAPINRSGPPPVDLSPPQRVDPAELRRRSESGEWVVDLRDRTAFAAGHLTGSLNFELGTNFVTYLGWCYSYGSPLTLIGDSEEQVAQARRELVRIGIDELAGAAVGDIETLADGQPLRSYRVTDLRRPRRGHGARSGADPGRPPQRRAGRRVRARLSAHPPARAPRADGRGSRRRGLGLLRLRLPGLHRRLGAGPTRPRRRADQRLVRLGQCGGAGGRAPDRGRRCHQRLSCGLSAVPP